MKEVQQSQAFFALAGLTKPKTPVGDEFHDHDYHVSVMLDFLLHVLCSHKKVCFV